MMNEKDLIKDFLLDDDLKDKDKKERVEIAWDIHNSFDKIMLGPKTKLMNKVFKKLQEENLFSDDYEIINIGSDEKWKRIEVVKKGKWTVDSLKGGVLFYALETEKEAIQDIRIGIKKFDAIKGIPFEGTWENLNDNDILKHKSRELCEIFEKYMGKGKHDIWWPAYKYLDSHHFNEMWKKEFYMQIVTKDGFDEAVNYILSEFKKMKEATEHLIDEFIDIYKRENP